MSRARIDLLDSVVSLHLASTTALAEDVGRGSAPVRRDLHRLAREGLVEMRVVSERRRLWFATPLGRVIVRRAA